ncbi:hypothetical protein [Streptomyces sp. SLBN-118]|uniref:hypothetical protein n=1 Tax=Streptomyces sp. SLBN-118 TaxID=2768454 RepID=UPI0021B32C49|nr:hypothetical protein [Streptomyces sp. SLBN-118]
MTDRGVTTTSAFSAMYDSALQLIREHDGPRVARSTARISRSPVCSCAAVVGK